MRSSTPSPDRAVLIEAKFNKPVKIARLVPIERAIVGRLFGIKIEVADTRLFGLVVRRPDGSRIYRVQPWKGGVRARSEPPRTAPGRAGPRPQVGRLGLRDHTAHDRLSHRARRRSRFHQPGRHPPQHPHVGRPAAHCRLQTGIDAQPRPHRSRRQGQPARLRMGYADWSRWPHPGDFQRPLGCRHPRRQHRLPRHSQGSRGRSLPGGIPPRAAPARGREWHRLQPAAAQALHRATR